MYANTFIEPTCRLNLEYYQNSEVPFYPLLLTAPFGVSYILKSYWTGAVAQLVECLLGVHKALGLISIASILGLLIVK